MARQFGTLLVVSVVEQRISPVKRIKGPVDISFDRCVCLYGYFLLSLSYYDSYSWYKIRNSSSLIEPSAKKLQENFWSLGKTCLFHCPTVVLAPGGGRVLPYLGYMGTCRWTGYGFWPRCPKQGIQFDLPLS